MQIFSAKQVDVKSDIQEQARLRATTEKKNSLLIELQGLKTNQENIKEMQNKQVLRIQEQLQNLQKEKAIAKKELNDIQDLKSKVQEEIKEEKLSVTKLFDKLREEKREVAEDISRLQRKQIDIDKKEAGLQAKLTAFKSKEALLNDTIEKTEQELREAIIANKENEKFKEELERQAKVVQSDYEWNNKEKKRLSKHQKLLDNKEVEIAERERKVEDRQSQLKAVIDNLKKDGKI